MSGAGEAILKLLLIGEDKSASKALAGVSKKSKETGEDVKKGLGKAVGGVSGMMGTLGGLAAATGIVSFGKDAISSFTDVGTASLKLSRLTGENVTDASRLRFAFQETGVDADSAGKALGIFSKNLSSGTAQKALAGIGIAAKDSSGHMKSMNDLLPGIADKFKAMPDGPEKTALAMKLFGKSGADLLKFLNKGSEGIAEMNAESDKFGLTITGPMADSVKDAAKHQKEWNAATEGLTVTLGSVLLPVMTKLVGFITEKVIPVFASASAFIGRHSDTIQRIGVVVLPIIGIIGGVVAAIRIWTIVQTALNLVMSLNPVGLIIIAVAALAAGLIYAYQHSEKFREIVNGAFQAISAAAIWLWNNALQPLVKMFVEGLSFIIYWLGQLLVNLGKIPGFEWAAKAGADMQKAADATYAFSQSINKIPEKKDVAINVTTNYSSGTAAALASGRAQLKLAQYASGGRPEVGVPAMFHANELWVPDTAGTVITATQSASLLRNGGPAALARNGAGGDTMNVYVSVQGDTDPDGAAKRIAQGLARLKKNRGNTRLEFEF